MRKIISVIILMIVPMIIMAQNPRVTNKTLSTANDTSLLGLKGQKTLRVEVASGDSVFIFIPDEAGVFSETNYIALYRGDNASLKFDGTKLITKSKSASVITIYNNGIDIVRKLQGFATDEPYTWTEAQRYGVVRIDSSLSMYNRNGNRWLYANGDDSSFSIQDIKTFNILPDGDKLYDLGSSSAYWKYGYLRHLIADSATIGYLTFTASDTTFANVIPTADSTYDIGSGTAKWKDAFIDGYVYLAGNATTDGSWRFFANLNGDMIFQCRVSGTWTEKSRITK